MSEPLFQNTVIVHANRARLERLLANPQNLPLWDDEITQVVATPTGFHVTRRSPALNEHERLTVTTTPTQVRYHSDGGRLAYHLDFTLAGEAEQTTVTEALSVETPAALTLPLSLLAPIAKQAFAQKLQVLAAVAESEWAVTD